MAFDKIGQFADVLPSPIGDWLHKRRLALIRRRDDRMVRRRARKIEKEQERIERRLARTLRTEARRVGKRLIDQSTQLGLCYIRRSGRKKGSVSEIRFNRVLATPAAFYFRLDARRNPFRVNTQMFEEPDILQDLAIAAHAPVRTHWTPRDGFWFIVERSGLASIPNYIDYAEVFAMMPKTAGPLDIPLGVGPNKKFYHTDIADLPHALIAGQTGGGKSNMLHVILCSLLQRATPRQLRLVMVDLKGGVELGIYRDAPHLADLGGDLGQRIYGRNEIAEVMRVVQREVNRRLQMFARERVRNVDRWNNKHRANRLAKWVVVIDEIANAMLVPKIKRKIEPVIADIGAQSRASGIHLVITTQHPIRDVVTGLLKANIPARIAFSTTSISASATIINSKKAYNLGPPGRLIYVAEQKEFICQAPFLSEDRADEIVAAVVEGRGSEATVLHEVTRTDIAAWCIDEREGRFVVDEVYGQFHKFGLTYRDVRSIQAELYASGAEIVVNDHTYLLKGKGNLRFFREVTDA
jgi:hypothetical protein